MKLREKRDRQSQPNVTADAPAKVVYKKQPNANGMLLRTYFTSLLCLVLCVTMFFGTTYAWFFSEVNNTGNEIYVGILSADLRLVNEGGVHSLKESGAPRIFTENTEWKPGHTAVETLQVVNQGDLAFSYTLMFTEGKVEDKAKSLVLDELQKKVTDSFTVFVYKHNGTETLTDVSYSSIIADESGWTKVGDEDDTLTDVLSGKAVLSGLLEPKAKDSQEEKAAVYTIAVHMKEDADISVMGHTIGMNVKLIAYQAAAGETNQYGQMVSTADELRTAFQKGGTVALAADITAEDVQTLAAVPENTEVELYLNDHSITASLKESTSDKSAQLFHVGSGAKLTIHGGTDEKNAITVTAAQSVSHASSIFYNHGGTVVINGGRYFMSHGSDALPPIYIENISTQRDATLIVNDGLFNCQGTMFRNFVKNSTATANLVINGGSFYGADGAHAQILNQKSATSDAQSAGTVTVKGGTFANVDLVDDNNSVTAITFPAESTTEPTTESTTEPAGTT